LIIAKRLDLDVRPFVFSTVSDPSRLILAEQLGRRASARLILEIDQLA
jgi:hypothetical protein